MFSSRLAPPDHSVRRKRSHSFSGSSAPPHLVVEANPRSSGKRSSSGMHGSGRRPDFPPGVPGVVPVNIASVDRSPIHPQFSSPSSSRVHFPEPRPSAIRRSTWSPPEHVNPFVPNLKIHRTIAFSNKQPALVYDVVFKPNHLNISTTAGTPIPPHTLNLPATLPRVTELTLVCRDLIWPVVVTSTTNSQHAITNLDVIEAVYSTLRTPVSRREWESLGHNSKEQARVADAYNKRCLQTKDWDNGVRRCDWLKGRTLLLGVESKANGTHELVFGK